MGIMSLMGCLLLLGFVTNVESVISLNAITKTKASPFMDKGKAHSLLVGMSNDINVAQADTVLLDVQKALTQASAYLNTETG